jgi:hypothetical protein
LSKFLALPELRKHRAMVAVELEVLAKKLDRFGWERDRGSMAHDRMLTDWMDALQDYPLDEVKAACVAAVLDNPNKMPNEGHVRAQILAKRAKIVAAIPKPVAVEPVSEKTEGERKRMADLVASAFPNLKRFGGAA